MMEAVVTKSDQALLAQVSQGKMLGIEPRETLHLLLKLQDRGLITMCATGWALTSDGKVMLENISPKRR
ncbi:MAG: hypothetical protein KF874_01175 [Rhizobiaceae bacterium]|nr:hypothetical protein [Rhizobiaceae bacterium]